MYSHPRPGFITSKGERKDADEIFYDPYHKYRELAKGLYIWEGLPKDVPDGYIEKALFDFGAVSAKFVKGLGIIVCPASKTLANIYGIPIKWVPTGQVNEGLKDITDMFKESENPVLFLDMPTVMAIEYDVDILWDAKISLSQNIKGMRQPIAFVGVAGNSESITLLDRDIRQGTPSIPIISGTKIQAEVLDLKVSDFTPSLMQVIQDQDAKILTIMGINNRGVEKESGINMEESTAHKQSLKMTSSLGLIKRQTWAKAISDALNADERVTEKVNITVKINPEYDEVEEMPNDGEVKEGDADDGTQ